MDYEVSDTLRKLLTERRKGVAGAVDLERDPHRPAARRGGAAAELEMNIRRGRIVSDRPLLILIEGGRK